MHELDFCSLLLKCPRNIKASACWFQRYRLDLIQQTSYVRRWTLHNCSLVDQDMVKKELKICHQIAIRSSRNYYAWTHRVWTLKTYADTDTMRSELSSMRTYLMTQPSNHSAFHYLMQILVILNEQVYEWHEIVESLDSRFPGHKTLQQTLVHLSHLLNMTLTHGALGTPLPPHSQHSVSVSLPTWQDVVDYEDGKLKVPLQTGYPRFFKHAFVRDLEYLMLEKFNYLEMERCVVFTSQSVVDRCRAYVDSKHAEIFTVHVSQKLTLFVFVYDSDSQIKVKQFWQHCGNGISSRCAEYALQYLKDCGAIEDDDNESHAKDIIRQRLSSAYRISNSSDVYLFPSGMSAINTAHQTCVNSRSNLQTLQKFIQFGFPYVDTLKSLQRFGPGCHFYPHGNEEDFQALEALLNDSPPHSITALFCEVPSNPLLGVVDIKRIRDLADKFEFMVVVDDTLGYPVNINVLKYADMCVTSLTKIYSGVGDVLAGSLVLNPESLKYADLKRILKEEYQDSLWFQDATVLELNSRDFIDRALKSNKTAELLCDFLSTRKEVSNIWYPKYTTPELYDTLKTADGGYGCLFSMTLSIPSQAPKFFNCLKIAKGPSLGTNFSIACPYTLLAHYGELEFVKKCGVDRHLVRVSVGQESVGELIHIFKTALDGIDEDH